MDLNATMTHDLLRSLRSAGDASSSRAYGVAGHQADLDRLVQESVRSQTTTVQISSSGRSMNDLYENLRSSDNPEAAAGFRNFMASAVTSNDGGSLENLVRMGTEAFDSGDSEFFTNLMQNFDALSEHPQSAGLARAMVVEAGETFADLGVGASRAFAETLNTILQMDEGDQDGGEYVSAFEVAQDFVSLVRDLRDTEGPATEKIERLEQYAMGTREQASTAGARDFITAAREGVGGEV